MKKSFSFFSRLASIAFTVFFVFCLFSCTGLLASSSETGSVSFVIDRALFNSTRSGTNGNGENFSYRVEVFLEDGNGYGVQQTVTISEEDFVESKKTDAKFVANFPRVPAGKQIYAIVKIYEVSPHHAANGVDGFEPEPMMYGKSDVYKIKAGKNEINLKAYNYRYDFPFSITLTFDELSESDTQSIYDNLLITAVTANSEEAKRVAAAGTDTYKIYNTLLNGLNGQGQLAKSYGADFSFNQSDKKLTVSGKMMLPVSYDDAATKGQDVILVATIYNYDSYTGQLKTKLFGKSEKITPVKGTSANTAAFSVKKINVVDTPIITYSSETGPKYTYNLNNTSYTSNGINSFCFDNNENTYWLSKDNGVFKIISSAKTEPLTISSDENYVGITFDNVKNRFYLYGYNQAQIRLYDCTSIINNWSAQGYNGNSVIDFTYMSGDIPDNIRSESTFHLVIHDGAVYDIVGSGDNTRLVIKNTIPDGQTIPDKVVDLDLDTLLSGIGSTKMNISDMIFIDDSIYMLVYEIYDLINGYQSWDDNFNSYSRGALIKYHVSDGEIKTIGWTSNPLNNSGKYVYGYNSSYNTPIYEDSARTIPFKIASDKIVNIIYGGKTIAFPCFYVPQGINDTSHFYGPKKFIAIKPKKLVIADDGLAFYTEADNVYKCKNANRIVTVDLETFAMTTTDTTAAFDYQRTSDISSSAFADKNTLCEAGKKYWDQGGSEFTGGDIKACIPLVEN